jgi:hypothetical protein
VKPRIAGEEPSVQSAAVRHQEVLPDYRRTILVSRVTFSSASGPGAAPPVPPGLESTIDATATSAAVELFGAYRVTIAAVTDTEVQLPIPDLSALGIVRFTASGLVGTAVVGVSAGTLRRSNTRGTSDRDWVAELANQYIGRFKLKLLRVGFELWSMTPVTVSGRLLATAVSQPNFTPILFRDAKGGSVAVWIEIDINGPLKVTPPTGDGEIPREGDVILF